MLGTVFIGPDGDLTDLLYRRCTEFPDLTVYKVLNEYPKAHQLLRLLNAYSPEVIFVEVGSSTSWELADDIVAERPDTAVIGYTRNVDLKAPPEGSGVAEIVHEPFELPDLQRAVSRALAQRQGDSRDNVLAFIPAKAGSGSSTTALNTASTLAQYWEQKIVVLEADVHSGCLAIQLKLNPEHSILDALEAGGSLDEKQWNKLVVHTQGLDLLLTPRAKRLVIISPFEYQRLLGFVSPRYDTVMVDLPEVVNDATEALVTRAKTVYVVCTNELTSLFLARRRLYELESRGVEPSRLGLILNRYNDAFEKVEEVEDLVGRKISVTLPNDYQRVRAATLGDGLVDGASALGSAYVSFARQLTGQEPKVPPAEFSHDQDQRQHSVKDFFASNLRGLLGKKA